MDAPDRDYAEGLDQLQADMAAHQRRFAGEVTADANQRMATAVIARLEKEDAARPARAPGPVVQAPVGHEDTTKVVEDRAYVVERRPSAPMYRTATEFEQQVLAHAQPRIALLLTKLDEGPLGTPSWAMRTQAAMYFKVKALEAQRAKQLDLADKYERAFMLDLYELLEASNVAFGDWRKDAPTKLVVSV